MDRLFSILVQFMCCFVSAVSLDAHVTKAHAFDGLHAPGMDKAQSNRIIHAQLRGLGQPDETRHGLVIRASDLQGNLTSAGIDFIVSKAFLEEWPDPELRGAKACLRPMASPQIEILSDRLFELGLVPVFVANREEQIQALQRGTCNLLVDNADTLVEELSRWDDKNDYIIMPDQAGAAGSDTSYGVRKLRWPCVR